MERWTNERENGSKTWHVRWKPGRWQFQITVHHHRYFGGSERWVLQPHVVLDRKQRRAEHD